MKIIYLSLFSLVLFGDTLPSFDPGVFSFYAVNAKNGDVLYDINSDTCMTPASCLKAVTCASALHLLGPEKRFETHLEHDGVIDSGGVLHGNLYIKGGGDPCLGSERFGVFNGLNNLLFNWVEAVMDKGIRKITGKVIGDASLWGKSLATQSLNYEDIGNYYGAASSALSINENSYQLVFKPGNYVGKIAEVLCTRPYLPFLEIRNEVRTGDAGSGDRACIYGTDYCNIQCARGSVPKGPEEFIIKGSIPMPEKACAELLKDHLQKQGINTSNNMIRKSGRKRFYTTYSPPIKEIVYHTNKKSINLYANHLLKAIGRGSTKDGADAIMGYWKNEGVDLSNFHMEDGSGGSGRNCVTTKQLVNILLKMKDSRYFPEFIDSLKTLRGCKVKSGSMSLVKGFTGYKDDIVFAVIVNKAQDTKTRKKLKSLLSSLGN